MSFAGYIQGRVRVTVLVCGTYKTYRLYWYVYMKVIN